MITDNQTDGTALLERVRARVSPRKTAAIIAEVEASERSGPLKGVDAELASLRESVQKADSNSMAWLTLRERLARVEAHRTLLAGEAESVARRTLNGRPFVKALFADVSALKSELEAVIASVRVDVTAAYEKHGVTPPPFDAGPVVALEQFLAQHVAPAFDRLDDELDETGWLARMKERLGPGFSGERQPSTFDFRTLTWLFGCSWREVTTKFPAR